MDSTRVSIEKSRFDAVIFDLDGVVTQTAAVHAAAWKRLFDAYLAERAARTGTSPGGAGSAPGARSGRSTSRPTTACTWTASRATTASATSWPRAASSCPWATRPTRPDGRPSAGSATARTTSSTPRSREHGVQTFPSTVALIHQLRDAGIRVGLMSSSKNTAMVLDVTGTTDLFEVRVDGVVAAEVGLPGKPDPAMYLETARRLGVDAARSVVVEDALSGVEAGRRGGFGLVIGVDRLGQAAELAEAGADVVVDDLAEVGVTA